MMESIRELQKSNRELLEQLKENNKTLKRNAAKLEELINDLNKERK